jgi:hypothetical protein
MNTNNTNPTCVIDENWNLHLSHGTDSNYLFHGEAIKLLIDHIKYLENLLNDCPGNPKYIALATEFYPFVETEAAQALAMGPPIQDHDNACKSDCPDCRWYNWALSFQQRIEQGEFDEINKFDS